MIISKVQRNKNWVFINCYEAAGGKLDSSRNFWRKVARPGRHSPPLSDFADLCVQCVFDQSVCELPALNVDHWQVYRAI